MGCTCGKCKSNKGKLIPVIVTSRNQTVESYAHRECIKDWKNTVDVKVDETRQPVEVKKK